MSGKYFLSLVILSGSVCNLCPALAEKCGRGKGEFIGHAAGGTLTKHGDWPWLVALIHRKYGNFFCGGSLISAKHVLSAAHCFQGKRSSEVLSPHQVEARLGKYNLDVKNETGSRSHLVREIVIHPEWKDDPERFDADIAILMLADNAHFDIFARPVCLPKASNNSVTGTGIVAGWGKSENSGNHYESTPSELELPAVDGDTCYTNVYKLGRYSSPRMFCGGFVNQSKATCSGDSGGGFFTLDERSIWTIRGIVSGGLITATYGCDVNAYSLFTNIARFRDWITGVMDGTFAWVYAEFHCEASKEYARLTACEYKSDEPITSSSRFTAKLLANSPTETTSLDTVANVDIDFSHSDHVLQGIGEEFPNLESLQILGQLVKFVKRQDFVNMRQLIMLKLFGLSIDLLPDDLLTDLPNLENIVMSSCKISELPEKIFANQGKLKRLVLLRNSLTILEKDLFKFNLELEYIDVEENNLVQIFVDFKGLPKILSIFLRKNTCMSKYYQKSSHYRIEIFQNFVTRCCGAGSSPVNNLLLFSNCYGN